MWSVVIQGYYFLNDMFIVDEIKVLINSNLCNKTTCTITSDLNLLDAWNFLSGYRLRFINMYSGRCCFYSISGMIRPTLGHRSLKDPGDWRRPLKVVVLSSEDDITDEIFYKISYRGWHKLYYKRTLWILFILYWMTFSWISHK